MYRKTILKSEFDSIHNNRVEDIQHSLYVTNEDDQINLYEI